MTPKEKAIELVEKMTFSCHECDTQWKAKQCALIAVDEILFAIQDLECENVNWDYWQEVKQEIENL
jgi:hypothetical protein